MARGVKKTAAPAAVPKVKAARRKPDFSGVPGQVVDVAARPIEWGPRTRRSPHDGLLSDLLVAGPNKALEFADPRAWASVSVRARKMGIKVEAAVVDGKLLVRVAPRQERTPEELREARHTAVLAALKATPANALAIAAWVRAHCEIDISGPQTESILGQLSRAGKVAMRADGHWHLQG